MLIAFLLAGINLWTKQQVIYHKFSETYIDSSAKTEMQLKIYVFFSKTHNVFFEHYFLPSLNRVEPVYELHVYPVEQLTETGFFGSNGWNATTLKKNEMILEAIQQNYGHAILYSDVDIQFLRPIKDALYAALGDYDLVIQKNGPLVNESACAGFVFLRCNAKTLELYEKIKQAMLADSTLRDQMALNRFLSSDSVKGLRWGYLPYPEFFCPLAVWNLANSMAVPPIVRMHHATWTAGIASKIEQLDYVRSKFAGNVSRSFSVDVMSNSEFLGEKSSG